MGEHIRVLLAEDHSDLRQLLDLTLSRHEFHVVSATDGADALEKLDEARPDVLVTDLLMPRVDGLGLVEAVRARKEYERIPVLLLTAVPHDPRARELDSLPRTHVMVKPPRLGDLEDVILELLQRPS